MTWLTLQEHLEYLFIHGIDPSTDCEDLLSKAGSVYLQEVMPLVNQTLLYLTVESQNIQVFPLCNVNSFFAMQRQKAVSLLTICFIYSSPWNSVSLTL